MAGKRQATSDLNHDNWDRDEEPEDAGHFREANEDELKRRVIKKARRRIGDDSATGDNGAAKNSIFGAFKGFGNAANTNTENTANKSSLFAFLSKVPTADTNIGTDKATIKPIATNIFKSTDKTDKSTTDAAAKDDSVYYSKILKLNQSFSAWIQKHVEEQPLCNLIPPLKDYEKHMNEIRKEHEQAEKSSTTATKPDLQNISKNFALPTKTVLSTSSSTTSLPASTTPLFSGISTKPIGFGAGSAIETQKGKTDENKLKSNGSDFSFGLKNVDKPNGSSLASSGFTFGPPKSNGNTTTSESSATTSLFSFGSSLNNKPAPSAAAPFSFGLKGNQAETKPAGITPISFGLKDGDAPKPSTSTFSFASSSTPFTFGNIKPPTDNAPKDSDDKANDEDEDEPPKEEIKEVVEDDALFTKKCKVFVKKDGAYKDYGVGTLFLKPVKESSKNQLLVRSCNNLGTILINVILVEGMPTQRMGKNNVMLVHPGADGDSKPQTTLFRVKDGTEADELLEVINKHKK